MAVNLWTRPTIVIPVNFSNQEKPTPIFRFHRTVGRRQVRRSWPSWAFQTARHKRVLRSVILATSNNEAQIPINPKKQRTSWRRKSFRSTVTSRTVTISTPNVTRPARVTNIQSEAWMIPGLPNPAGRRRNEALC